MSWRRMRSGLIASTADGGGSSAVAFLGAEEVYIGPNDSGSTSLTIPADCDCVVLAATYTETNDLDIWPETGVTINGVDMTKSAHCGDDELVNTVSGACMWVLAGPATGARTCAWAFVNTTGGVVSYGGTIWAAYFKNVDPSSPIAAAAAEPNNGGSNSATPLSLAADADDMTLHLVGGYNAVPGDSHGGTVIRSSLEDYCGFHWTRSPGETAPGHDGSTSYMCHCAVVLKAA